MSYLFNNGLSERRDVPLDEILIPEDHRTPDPKTVARLAVDMRRDFFEPISLSSRLFGTSKKYRLVCGGHRLAAARQLGWPRIPAVIRDMDEKTEILQTIAENFNRAELSLEERAKQFATYKSLTNGKLLGDDPSENGSQTETKVGRPEGGAQLTGRALGMDRNEAHRMDVVSRATDETWEAAKEAGVADNAGVIIETVKQAELTGEEQTAVLETIVAKRNGAAKSETVEPVAMTYSIDVKNLDVEKKGLDVVAIKFEGTAKPVERTLAQWKQLQADISAAISEQRRMVRETAKPAPVAKSEPVKPDDVIDAAWEILKKVGLHKKKKIVEMVASYDDDEQVEMANEEAAKVPTP
jgi:ParB-like nuclease domain